MLSCGDGQRQFCYKTTSLCFLNQTFFSGVNLNVSPCLQQHLDRCRTLRQSGWNLHVIFGDVHNEQSILKCEGNRINCLIENLTGPRPAGNKHPVVSFFTGHPPIK